MVRVYAARIPGGRQNHTEQSAWAYRLLEIALKREHPEISAPVCVEKDGQGKPFLKDYPRIHISISHSGGFVACALGDNPVGVDVEVWKTRKNPKRIVEKFHPLEKEGFYNTEESERLEIFYNLWVLKESFMKAEGRGMRIPLDAFCVLEMPGTDAVLKVEQTLNERQYYCRLFPVADQEISLAVCGEEKEMEEQPVWLTLPEEFSQTV